MPKFTLLLRDAGNLFADLSPAEIQTIIGRYAQFRERLESAGRLHASQKLRNDGGRSIRRRNGQLSVTDGPYSEAKEVVGGLYVIEAESYDDAVKIAESCPHLDYGTIEVREVEIMR